MLDEYLRRLKDRLLNPIVNGLVNGASRFSTPNQISFLALGCAIACFWNLAFRSRHDAINWPALIWWSINRILDGIDGALARATGSATSFGGLLDIACDQVAYVLLPVGLVLGRSDQGRTEVICLVWMLGSFYINIGVLLMLGGLLEKSSREGGRGGKGRTKSTAKTALILPTGLIEGAETIIFYYIFLLLPRHLAQLYILFAVLITATAVQRLLWAWRNL
jgi:phosphatidylglycerophosphate synthase